jgi:hypothetical protein
MLIMLVLGLTVSGAHAAEFTVCLDGPAPTEMGHANGDSDEVPADAGKGFPHHHASCSGHHLADEVSENYYGATSADQLAAVGKRIEGQPSGGSGPALRPPIA